jgi:Zn-dependent protease with chaperone function
MSGIVVCWAYWGLLSDFWWEIIPVGFFTFLYSAPKIPFRPFIWLRRFAVAKTLYLSLAWVYITTVLPIVVAGGVLGGSRFWWFLGYRFCFIFVVCLLFDLRDRGSDGLLGIRNVSTLFRIGVVEWIFWVGVFGCLVCGYCFGKWFVLLFPVFLLVCLFRWARRDKSDWLYYGLLDGLLGLSGLLGWFFS